MARIDGGKLGVYKGELTGCNVKFLSDGRNFELNGELWIQGIRNGNKVRFVLDSFS